MKTPLLRHIDIQASLANRIDRQTLSGFLQRELARQKAWPNYQISLYLISDKEIKSLKARYFGVRKATDVISLNYSTVPGYLEGEIHISLETARQQAKQYRVSLQDEVRRLAVHGLLHLLGYTDEEQADRLKMAELENAALRRLKKRLTLM
jgi:probable rRNA maturation factor